MHHVIIGNGVAGITAARTIRELDDSARITIISDEHSHFYARTALMWIYMRQLTLRDTEPFERWFWREKRLDLMQGRATGIDRAAKTVTLHDGQTISYDRLLLALGGKANMFGWPGQELDGVCNMTTLKDLAAMEAVRPRLERAVVVGGGLVGIELAEMMLHDHVPLTYLIREPWYWDMALSEQEARLVEAQMRDHGVDLVLEDEIGEIRGDGKVERLVTKKGVEYPCQLVGVAVGVGSRVGLARDAGLEVGRGVVVDEAFRTSDPDIFAVGDCSEIHLPGEERPRLEKLWYTGQVHGAVAAQAMLGQEAAYAPGIPYNSAQFLFLDYLTVGWMKRMKPELEEHFEQAAGARESVRIAHDGERVMGFSMLGPRWHAGVLMRWIQERRTLAWGRDHLSEAAFNEELRKVLPPGEGVRHG